MPRLDKTATDYVAIALSPVLIMLMVGSLMFFLVAVFYRGCFEGRIYWILSCYTLAIVLIARISIEEGQDRAMLYGAALALAAGFAVMRMSDVVLLPWLLLALVWWAADKLTWDCTLIDEDEDSSGRGLLQVVGLDWWRKTAARGLSRFSRRNERGAADSRGGRENGTVPLATKPETGDADAEPEGVTVRDAHPKRASKRRPHAPGVWIVYFSLAALPLFGLGQVFLPSGDVERRRWAFELLCVYVASGLGLLLTTSFLGLRRYLRRRGVQMPDDMARAWIALGAALIVVLLFVAALLPRPAPEIALSRFPIRFTTPQREPSRYAFGGEGADTNAPDSQSFTESDSDADSDTDGNRDRAEKTGEQGESERGEPEKRQPGTSDSSQRNQAEGETAEKGEPSDGQKGKSPQASSGEGRTGQRQSDGREPGQTDRDEQADQQPQGRPQEKGESPSQGERKPSQAEAGDEPTDHRQQGESSSDNARTREQKSQPREQDQQPGDQEKDQKEEPSRAAGSTRRAPPASPPRQPSGSGFRLPRLDLALGGLLKLLLYAVVLGLLGYWLWKSRAQVLSAIQQFLLELSEFWARLFGGGQRHDEETVDEKPAEPPRPRPFSDYADPFASGAATRHPPEAIVRYTFEALEAWAREQGCPRPPDQTPREFARQVGNHDAELRAGAAMLADLYCRVAYASARLSPKGIKPLEPFWQVLGRSGRARRAPPATTSLP